MVVVWNKFGSKSHKPVRDPSAKHTDRLYSLDPIPTPPYPSSTGAECLQSSGCLHVSAKGIGNPACPHSYPPLWQGTPKVVISSGGALYQPVTMVTSQGQVVTQAIPQGAIQIQNTQVSVCVQCRCVHMCMGLGEGNRTLYCLLGTLHQ